LEVQFLSSAQLLYFVEMHTKTKGELAELFVAARLTHVLFPFGENSRYDLVAERRGKFVRVQVKYATPKNGALPVKCASSNNWSTKSYLCGEIDVVAAYNSEDQQVYFVPVSQLKRREISLRLDPARNGQVAGVRYAKHFRHLA
jgi:Holliday junction resolvase-like predicted endonuclease